MEIRIGSYVSASFLLEQEPKRWHAIIILDSNSHATDFVASHALSHLYLRFDDIEEHREGKCCATVAQIAEALEFAKGKDRLLVSCRAGQGRSAALAYLISCAQYGKADPTKLLNPERHRPNRLVVSLGNAMLQSGEVLEHFDEWRRSYAHVRLSDYYDEMEAELDAIEALGASNRIC